MILKESKFACLKWLSCQSPVDAEKAHENPQPRWPLSCRRFDPRTSLTCAKNIPTTPHSSLVVQQFLSVRSNLKRRLQEVIQSSYHHSTTAIIPLVQNSGKIACCCWKYENEYLKWGLYISIYFIRHLITFVSQHRLSVQHVILNAVKVWSLKICILCISVTVLTSCIWCLLGTIFKTWEVCYLLQIILF